MVISKLYMIDSITRKLVVFVCCRVNLFYTMWLGCEVVDVVSTRGCVHYSHSKIHLHSIQKDLD